MYYTLCLYPRGGIMLVIENFIVKLKKMKFYTKFNTIKPVKTEPICNRILSKAEYFYHPDRSNTMKLYLVRRKPAKNRNISLFLVVQLLQVLL